MTYHKDVLPILQNRCQECHRPDEAAPFLPPDVQGRWFLGGRYQGVHAEPQDAPWKATGGMKFLYDRRLPATEIDTLAAWVDGGTPEGDPKDAPAKVFTTGWSWANRISC